jgi:hypothetical protein
LQAPHRYDLKEWSCVNVERKPYNRKLNKLMKKQKYVTIMNVDFETECFTGLHMNGHGKTMIAQQIADRCKNIFFKEKTHPMPMKWTFYQDDTINSSKNIEPANNCNSIKQESELLLQHVQEEEIGGGGEWKRVP